MSKLINNIPDIPYWNNWKCDSCEKYTNIKISVCAHCLTKPDKLVQLVMLTIEEIIMNLSQYLNDITFLYKIISNNVIILNSIKNQIDKNQIDNIFINLMNNFIKDIINELIINNIHNYKFYYKNLIKILKNSKKKYKNKIEFSSRELFENFAKK